jgi:hypothetical protein
MSHIVDLEWQGDPPEFYCPVCGTAIVTENGPNEDRCEHVNFLYVHEAGDFEFIDSKYKSFLKEFDDDLHDDIIEFLMEKANSTSAIALNLTTNGMDSGPVSFTVTFGMDFNPTN